MNGAAAITGFQHGTRLRFLVAVALFWLSDPLFGLAQAPIPPAPDEVPGGTETMARPVAAHPLLMDRPISQLKASIASPTAVRPQNVARESLDQAGLVAMPFGQGRGWCLQPLIWDASAVRHLPTYFEEPNLERLGYYYGFAADRSWHDRFWGLPNANDPRFVGADGQYFTYDDYLASEQPRAQYLQPIVSALNFYGRVAALPYLVGAQDHLTPIYGLGEDRPGSPVIYRKHYMPLSALGILYQSSVAVGFAYLIP